MKGIIYKINIDNEIYIGSTTEQYLSTRQSHHNYSLRNRVESAYLYKKCIEKNITKIICEFIKYVEYENLDELRIEEELTRQEYNATLNEVKCYRSNEERLENDRNWYHKNKEKRQDYIEKNKEVIKQKKNQKINCPICNKLITKYNMKRHIDSQHHK